MSTALRLTLAEYDRMIEQGVFDEARDRRIELICGELREMAPPGPSHEDVIDLLGEWSYDDAPRRQVRIRIQNSIGLPPLDSAPQPDLAWVRRKSYRKGRPRPRDVFLVIEVSDSTLDYDRFEKAALYARAGIRDYWVVNIPGRCIEVFRNPRQGKYRTVEAYHIGESVRPLAFPEIELAVATLF